MAAAELKLQVGLDLAFFRQQLAQLGTAATGYSLPINIDRLAIQEEITKLGRNISNRSYTLKVKTTAAIAEAEVDKLKTALDNLQGKEVGIKITGTVGKIAPKDATKIRNDLAEAVAGGTGKKILVDVGVRENAIGEELRAVRKALNEKITPKNGKILVATSIRSGITSEEAKEFRESVKRKIGNIIVDVTGSADQLRAKEAKGIRASLYQSIISNGGKIKIPATLTIADSEVAAFQKAVNSKFAGITVKVKAEIEEIRGGKAQAQIEKEALAGWQRIQEMGAARMSGGVSDPARRESLRQSLSGRDIGELRNIGEQLGVKGARRYSNVQNLIEKIVADASIEMVKKYLDPQAVMRNPDRSGLGKVLDTFARGIFHMLGMDPAAMMAAERQKRLPPAINWPASAATPAQYQSQRGTMLAGAPALKSISGTAFGAQKYLPTALGDETKKVLRDAANAFLDTIKQGIREVRIRDLGKTINGQAMLSGRNIAGLLPPGVGRMPNAYTTGAIGGETQAERFARREREARTRSSFREMDVMGGGNGRTAASYSYAYRAARPTSAIIPYGPGGALTTTNQPPTPPTPPTPPGGGRGGLGSFGSFGGAMPNVSLPGAGLVRELGDQFGYAAKQVLLFGATYKALAFLTDFPAKVGETVAQLQTFRNTLQAITPNADEFQKSNQFILDTAAKYNTPLQSARDGFTNLYASMAPAGFKGDDIRNIFTGISQGAATFGMSADKVDRVNYAFAQMASKGQVMSEELKGQLGDVLPGAVAIFAKAAGFTGPNAMVDFTKAMEDGRYKGEAMKQLLINVGIVMKDKFAKGAEGAAQNFQGQMNAMANATKTLYETFEPAGNLFASKIIAPFASGLQVLADGFSAFFANTAAKTAGGFALFQELEKLRPTFKGIADNIKQLLPLLQSFATTALGLGKILLQIAGNPFAGYLARVYLAVLPLTIAIQALNLQALIPMIGSFLRAIPAFAAFSVAAWNGASRTKALGIAMQVTGQTSAVAGGQVVLLSNALKTAFVGTVVGAVVIGIGMIIERIMTLSGNMEGARASALKLGDAIKGMSQQELQIESNKLGREAIVLNKLQAKSKGKQYALLSDEERKLFERIAPGLIVKVQYRVNSDKLEPVTQAANALGLGMFAVEPAMMESARQKLLDLKSNVASAQSDLKAADKKITALAPIPGAGGDPKAAKAAATALASQQALADKLSSDQTKINIERQKTLFENEKSMINMAYDLREARANSFQKETIRFQRELFNIEMERQKAVLDANSAITKAQGAVAGGTGGATRLLQGSTGISSGAHFDVRRQDGGYISPQQARALFDASVAKQLQLTSTYGPRKAPVAGASTFHRGVDLAGPANTPLNLAQGYSMVGAGMKGGLGYTASVRGPQGEMYDVGHLQQPSVSIPSGKVTARQKKVALADQQTENALQDRKVNITLAEAVALEKAKIATENYVASIMPVAELKLQNQLLTQRNQLQLSGAGDAEIEQKTKVYELDYKKLDLEKNIDALRQKKTLTDFEATQLNNDVNALKQLNAGYEEYIANLVEERRLKAESAYSSNMGSLKNQLQLAGIVDPYAEQRQKYMQGGQSAEQADAQVGVQKQIDAVTRLRDAYRGVADTIGSSFGDAFKGIITGSMTAQEALAGFFQNIGNYFVDMVAKMVAEWAKTQVLRGFQSLLGGLSGMFGGGGSSGFFGAGAPDAVAGGGIFSGAGPYQFANGGIATGGFRAFATGGIVTGPTLGLIGEGRYNEAVIPLPDGKSVPVDLGGMSDGMSGGPITVNVSVDAKGTEVQGDNGQSAALGRAIAASVQAELIKQKRPGGLLAR